MRLRAVCLRRRSWPSRAARLRRAAQTQPADAAAPRASHRAAEARDASSRRSSRRPRSPRARARRSSCRSPSTRQARSPASPSLESAGPGVRRAPRSPPPSSSSSSRRPSTATPIPVKITYRYAVHVHREARQEARPADFAGVVRDRAHQAADRRTCASRSTRARRPDRRAGQVPDPRRRRRASTRSRSRARAWRPSGRPRPSRPSKQIDATYEVDKKKEKCSGGRRGRGDRRHRPAPQEAGRLDRGRRPTQAREGPRHAGRRAQGRREPPGVARAAVGSGALVVWGVGAAGHARLRRRRARAAPLPRRRVPLDPAARTSSSRSSSCPGLRPELRARPRRARHRRACGPSTRTASTAASAPTSSTRRPTCAPRSADRVHVAVGSAKELPRHGPRRASRPRTSGNIVPIPRYWDGQARVVYDLAPHETIELGGLVSSSDRIANTLLNPDPSLTTRQTSGTDFQRIYLRYEKHMADGAVVDGRPVVRVRLDDARQPVRLRRHRRRPTTPTSSGCAPTGTARSCDHVCAATWASTSRCSSRRFTATGSIGAPPREGDIYVFGQPPPVAGQRRRLEDRRRHRSRLTPRRTSRCSTTACTSSRACASSPSSPSTNKIDAADRRANPTSASRARRP